MLLARPAPLVLQIFEYLLQQGADPGIPSFPCPPDTALGEPGQELSVLDVAVHRGFSWDPGEVRAALRQLIDKHASVPKRPSFVYAGPEFGERLASDMRGPM